MNHICDHVNDIDNLHVSRQCAENHLVHLSICSDKNPILMQLMCTIFYNSLNMFTTINLPSSSIYNLIPALEAGRAKKSKELV